MTAAATLGVARQLTRLTRLFRTLRQRSPLPGTPIPPALIGLLTLIAEGSARRGKDLALRSGLEPSTISRSLRVLVEHGLVAREIDPHDGRAQALSVTPAGRQTLASAAAWMNGLVEDALHGWSDAEIEAFIPLFARFVSDLSDQLDPGAPATVLAESTPARRA